VRFFWEVSCDAIAIPGIKGVKRRFDFFTLLDSIYDLKYNKRTLELHALEVSLNNKCD